MPGDEARALTTEEDVTEYVQQKGVDMDADGKYVLFTIDVYLWDEGSRRFRIWRNTPNQLK